MAKSKLDQKCFLNVDLEVFSKPDLKEFVAALGRKVAVLYIGKEFGANKAYLELSVPPKTPDAGVLGFCKLIENLPPRGRALWDAAKSRTFDIGIDAPRPGDHYWTAVRGLAHPFPSEAVAPPLSFPSLERQGGKA
jgi:hypothetical protein